MSFSIQKGSSKKTGHCLLSASDDMTIYSASQNHSDLVEHFANYDNFEIDLSTVEEIDSSGIQLLLALKQSAERESKSVSLSAISETASEVMNVLNIKDQFDWSSDKSVEK